MKIKTFAISLFAALVAAACCHWVPSSAPAAGEDAMDQVSVQAVPGWVLKICPRQTEAASIEFRVGVDQNDNATLTWAAGQSLELSVPAPYENTSPLWIEATVFDRRLAHVCVLHGGAGRGTVITDRRAVVQVAADATVPCACED